MIEIIRFLRNEFAHKTGHFNPANPKSVQLRERLHTQFKIDPSIIPSMQFPLDKNEVIRPLVDGIKKYVEAFWKKPNE